MARAIAIVAIAFALVLTGVAQTPARNITITLTGQSMIRSDLRATAPAAMPRIKALLKGDVVFTNFEGAIAEPGQSVTGNGRGFLAPAAALDALQAMGFNLLALANNHAFDLNTTGIQNTLREVTRRNLVHAGIGATLSDASAPAYLRLPNMTIALVASASGLIADGGRAGGAGPGVNELRLMAGEQVNTAREDLPAGAPANVPHAEDAQRVLQSIREAKRRADLVIVYQHNHVFSSKAFSTIFSEGMDERLAPNPWLQKWTHAEIEAGADIVVMHGAPLLHGIEMFRGKPIFYDLGNFIYNLPPAITYITEPMAWESVVASLTYADGKLTTIALSPLALNYVGSGQPDMLNQYTSNEFLHTRGLPSPAAGPQARYILERVATLSKPFGTSLQIERDRALIALRR